MRDTRVLYVENDPALRGIVSRALAAADGIELLVSSGTPAEVLDSELVSRADAALLDLALGADVINGIDLGIALRERNPNIGIVVYSQYSTRNVARRVPAALRMGWAFMPKSGDMRVEQLVEVLRATAQGLGHRYGQADETDANETHLLEQLTPRQRAVIALAAEGYSAPEISARLGITHDAARKDLSKA